MSQQPQLDNFSQINLNAIKNTKLFQKFMQNKSALTPKDNNPQKNEKNSSSGPINNQKHEKELTLAQGQKIKIYNKKWNAKQIQQDHRFREDNLSNTNNYIDHISQGEDLRINKNINNRQNKSLQPGQNENESVNRLQNIKLTHLQQSIQGQNSYLEPYQKMKIGGAYREHENFSQIEHEIPNQSQFVNPTNEVKSGADRNNRRKRNFNSNQFQNNSARKTVNNNFVEQKSQENENFSIGNLNQPYEKNNQYIENANEKKSNRIPIQQQWEVQANNRSYQNANIYNRSGHQSSPNRLKPTQFPTLTEPGYNSTFQPFVSQKPISSQDSYQNPSQKPQPVHPSSVHISEQDYKSRYESILKKYEQLKLELKTENKNHKKQFNSWEHQIQMLKEKLFSVQSREDSLLIENQRFKQKYEAEAMNKLKTQEENKELTYKIKQLQDQLNMKQHTLRQKNQELNFWKSQTEAMKQQLNSLRLMLQKRNDQFNLIQGDYQILKKQRDNKDYLLQELRKNVGILVQENSAAKDEIFSLVTKLYQLEQHNQVLKNDLKRQSMDHSHLNTYMQQIQQKQSQVQRLHQQSMGNRERTVSTQQQRPPFQRHEHTNNRAERSFTAKNQSFVGQNHHKERYEQKPMRSSLTEQQNPNVAQKPTRRRGQFARQRGQVVKNEIKAQKDQRPIHGVKQNISNMNASHDNRANQPIKPSFSANDNKFARIQSISEELQKIKDMKAMNGAIRRRKIDLERELQQLQAQLH